MTTMPDWKTPFLDGIRRRLDVQICRTCGNLTRVGENLIGCAAHDKLIMPEYPPYHGNARCPDWETRKDDNHEHI